MNIAMRAALLALAAGFTASATTQGQH